MIKHLPPDLKQEVVDFIQFLREKHIGGKNKKMNLSWAGALSEYRDKFTSLSLQKKSLEWWGD